MPPDFTRAPFIPKLQGYFAEFLQHHSLKRLNILYPSTSVGFEYDLYVRFFPGNLFEHKKIHIPLCPRIFFSRTGHGILTVFPSALTIVFALGVDLPIADYHCNGTLGFSAGMSFTCLPVTYVSILTSFHFIKPHDLTSTFRNAPLPLIQKFLYKFVASVYDFSPVTSSAQPD